MDVVYEDAVQGAREVLRPHVWRERLVRRVRFEELLLPRQGVGDGHIVLDILQTKPGVVYLFRLFPPRAQRGRVLRF